MRGKVKCFNCGIGYQFKQKYVTTKGEYICKKCQKSLKKGFNFLKTYQLKKDVKQ
jgi:transposase-like protein